MDRERPFAEVDELKLELRLRIFALPLALIAARALVAFGAGRMLTRIFVAMWIHETGHAIAAWLCGYLAFPGPWLTPMSAERSPLFAFILSFALIYASYLTWSAGQRARGALFIALLAVHLVCSLALQPDTAKQMIVFAGDGGCFVLGTILMTTVYSPPGSALHRGFLRWGCLAIGAGAFMDVFEQWWSARTDIDRIPFGMNEGVGPSDPSVLSDTYGWSAGLIVHRYVLLGCFCLAGLAIAYVWQWSRARAALEAARA